MEKQEIKRETAVVIATEGEGLRLQRIHYSDGSSVYCINSNTDRFTLEDLWDDDEEIIERKDVYYSTFEEFWANHTTQNYWHMLHYLQMPPDIEEYVTASFRAALTELNYSQSDIDGHIEHHVGDWEAKWKKKMKGK